MAIEDFFHSGGKQKSASVGGYSLEFIHKHQCRICPLKRQHGFKPKHPEMPASGSKQPLIYMLGEAPGEEEDNRREPFVGRAGRYVRERIPQDWRDDLRWSNVVRTRPKDNASPEEIAVECCRPSVAADIAESGPAAIFGFGNVPLHWALRRSGISKWNGRRIPVSIDGHVCWYFPMLHPSYVVRLSGAAQKDQGMRKQYEEASFVFDLDLKRALAAVAEGLPEPVVHSREDAEADIELLHSPNGVVEALRWFAQHEETVGIDLETHKLRPYADESRVLSCAISRGERSIAFPIGHPQSGWSEQQRDLVWQSLLDFLLNAPCRKVQFTPFEMEWLAQRTSRDILWSKWADAQGQAYLLDARQGTLSLDFLCLQYFGLDLKAISNVDPDDLINTPLDTVLNYNALDAKYHRLLYLEQAQRIKQEGLEQVWQHHNKRVTAAVLTQLNGVPVNADTVSKLDEKYSAELDTLAHDIQELPLAKEFAQNHRRPFRPSATADIKLLFPRLDTAQEEELSQVDDPMAKLILRWKHFAKVHSTYIAPVLPGHERCALSDDGMLHPALLVNRVRTWRSSSEAPNIQNWPKHDEGREARSQIEAPAGHSIVAFDYGQIQARNVAQESLDKKLVKSMWDRHDIHADWRDRIFELYPAWAGEGLKTVLKDKALLKQYRQKAKNGFVFASFFGAGGRTVANHLGIPEGVGYQLAEEFDYAFPGITNWQKGLHRSYQQDGYVTGLSGFRRYAPVAHTEIINTPIQSDEAVIVFDAMIRLAETGEPHYVANLMVHDSLEFVWPNNKIDDYAEFVVKTIMDCPFPWVRSVPLQVEMGIGSNWSNIKEVSVFETDRDWNWK